MIIRDWWKVRLCHGCRFLRVGRKVDCRIGGPWQKLRVAGRIKEGCYNNSNPGEAEAISYNKPEIIMEKKHYH